jgi:hypothetical protein
MPSPCCWVDNSGTSLDGFIARVHRHGGCDRDGPAVLLGSGIPLFGPLSPDIRLQHVATRSYPSGLVQREPAGFTPAGHSMLLEADIWSRPKQFDPGLLATFPAFGPPAVVVIGRAEATGKRSVAWVLTLLHEHFHQYQMSEPGYFAEVEQLGLSGGDQTGTWMLNYPFPYESPKVASAFASVSRELGRMLVKSLRQDRRRFWQTYAGFLDLLSERDRRYLSFQVWQEGVARYVELRVAELAAQAYKPSLEFRQLRDVEPFAKAAERMRAAIRSELAAPDLAKQKRVGFYAFGAGLALLLDRDGSAWKRRYMKQKFFLGGG